MWCWVAQNNNDATNHFIDQQYGTYTRQSVGSQLKFCYIAEGRATVYPRLCHTMKTWDIAAGQAIIEGAGGVMTRPDGTPISYTHPDHLAGDFIAKSPSYLP